jgi:hypothetical protein
MNTMENIDLPPWDSIDPALTAERIAAIAAIIRDETDAKIDARDPRDWNWNIGCDCHAWVLNRMHASAKGEHADWLFMESEPGNLDLTFRIGGKDGVQVKLYRPDAPGQPERTLRQANEELKTFQEALLDLAPAPDPAIRFAVDKDDTGRVTRVTLVQLTLDGKLLYPWTVWVSDTTVRSIDDTPKPEGVELEEPNVMLPEDEEQADEKDKKDKQEGA